MKRLATYSSLLLLVSALLCEARGDPRRRSFRRHIATAVPGAMEIKGRVNGLNIGLKAGNVTRRYRISDPFDRSVTGASDVASLYVKGKARRPGALTVGVAGAKAPVKVKIDRGDSSAVVQNKLMQAIGELADPLRWVRTSGRRKLGPRVATLGKLYADQAGGSTRRKKKTSKRQVISWLKLSYPGKAVFPNRKKDPTEIVCEVEPSTRHPSWSRAVAAIFDSAPHKHNRATETYKVLKGTLAVTIDGKTSTLEPGQSVRIKPGQVHSSRAVSDTPVLLEATSRPGWRFDDQIPVAVP
jgi:mannose-6-phosphate isomerase-like protein (cupin superfamily)